MDVPQPMEKGRAVPPLVLMLASGTPGSGPSQVFLTFSTVQSGDAHSLLSVAPPSHMWVLLLLV